MKLRRLLQHLLTRRARVALHFPGPALAAMQGAISAAEQVHSGEIRFVIEAALEPAQLLRGLSPRARALELFAQLGVWDTEHNNGVLIYILYADHAIEIVADRGIHARSGAAAWQHIAAAVETAFAAGDFAAGALQAIAGVAEQLQRHGGRAAAGEGELPNHVTLL